MASKHREQRVIAAVACPRCGAQIGELCRQTISGRPQIFSGRPIVHQERRDAWREWKRDNNTGPGPR